MYLYDDYFMNEVAEITMKVYEGIVFDIFFTKKEGSALMFYVTSDYFLMANRWLNTIW